MDVGLSADPVESFRMFQSRVLEIYDQLTQEFGHAPNRRGRRDSPISKNIVRTMVQEILRDYDLQTSQRKNGITSHPS